MNIFTKQGEAYSVLIESIVDIESRFCVVGLSDVPTMAVTATVTFSAGINATKVHSPAKLINAAFTNLLDS